MRKEEGVMRCEQTGNNWDMIIRKMQEIFQKVKLFFFFFIGVHLLYNVVLVSAVQQSELSICIYISPPSSISYPTFLPRPIHLCLIEYQAELPILHKRFLLGICFTHGSAHTSIPVSQFIPQPLLCLYVCFLFLYLYSCPENRFS